MWKEFKEFILRGNVVELAVGLAMGTAFTAIVNSLVNDIIMPLISALFGKVDFSEWIWKLGNTTIPYGSFISAIVSSKTSFTLSISSAFLNIVLQPAADNGPTAKIVFYP